MIEFGNKIPSSKRFTESDSRIQLVSSIILEADPGMVYFFFIDEGTGEVYSEAMIDFFHLQIVFTDFERNDPMDNDFPLGFVVPFSRFMN